ncbi:MAG: divergent PAP2 family protein [Anaeroplasmataceae bacterium]|nr:divergent PAP2 family protein [Anaeroplasmataceae bacterium]
MVFLADDKKLYEEFLKIINTRAIQIICICLVSMLICQLLKFAILSIREKKCVWKYLFYTGGFPSSHTCLCMTLVTSLFLFQLHDINGIDWSFAVAVVFALITIHDSMGIRLEASKHAVILNNFAQEMSEEEKQSLGYGKKGRLKELLGHHFYEVVGGMIFGVIFGISGYFILVSFI